MRFDQLLVIQEKQDLDKRIASLDHVTSQPDFLELHIDERCLMVAQLTHMQDYARTLSKRIERFKGTLQ